MSGGEKESGQWEGGRGVRRRQQVAKEEVVKAQESEPLGRDEPGSEGGVKVASEAPGGEVGSRHRRVSSV